MGTFVGIWMIRAWGVTAWLVSDVSTAPPFFATSGSTCSKRITSYNTRCATGNLMHPRIKIVIYHYHHHHHHHLINEVKIWATKHFWNARTTPKSVTEGSHVWNHLFINSILNILQRHVYNVSAPNLNVLNSNSTPVNKPEAEEDTYCNRHCVPVFRKTITRTTAACFPTHIVSHTRQQELSRNTGATSKFRALG